MQDVLILANDGSEEMEVLAPLDMLRRAGLSCCLCSLTSRNDFESSHGVVIRTDARYEDIDPEDYRAIFLPGGLPGAETTAQRSDVQRLLQKYVSDGKWIFSICAGPLALMTAGLSQDIQGTCYPGFEAQVAYQEAKTTPLVKDGKIVTAKGPAVAPYLGIAMVDCLCGRELAMRIAEQTIFNDLVDYIREVDEILAE